MDDRASPVLLRRRLRSELRAARRNSNLTQEQVAAAMEWSLSKMNRIEQAKSGISINDLKALLPLYGITDEAQTRELLVLARVVARTRGSRSDLWWKRYTEVAPATLLELLDYEAAASVVNQFETTFVPGILQTEEYASAVLQVYYDEQSKSSPERVAALVDLRTKRRDLLARMDAPRFFFILDESVIRRQIGSRAVMSRQLNSLADAAGMPNVTLQIVPFTAGLHSGMRQPFKIIQFAAEPDENVVFLESPRGDLISDNVQEFQNYLTAFNLLADQALEPSDSVDRLRRVATEMA